MDKLAWYCFVGGFLMFGVATLLYWWYAATFFLARRARAHSRALTPAAAAIGGSGTSTIGEGGSGDGAGLMGFGRAEIARYALFVQWMGFICLTASLIFRTIATGHGPYSNQYEFSIAFAWGACLIFILLDRQYHARHLGAVVMLVPLALMAYAATIPATIEPLIPALQNNLLLTIHVAMAVVAYGGFTVAFAAAILYLINRNRGYDWLPDPELLDELAYKSVIVGFPMMFMNLVLGAVWANVAWGGYWSWDPKETAALVTWLLYGIYIHAHSLRAYRGTPTAILLIIGFVATIFTFFGVNLFIAGLHSYSGLG